MGVLDRVRDAKILSKETVKFVPPPTFQEVYQDYLKTDTWKELRALALKRDNNECRLCDKKAEDVHHRKYPLILGTEPLDYLTSLCGLCHDNYHNPDIKGLAEYSDDLLKRVKGNNEKIRCRACKKVAQTRNLLIDKKMAKWISDLIEVYFETNDWVSVKDIVKVSGSGKATSSGAELFKWGMCVPQPNEKNPEKNKSGMWKPTKLGIDFAMNNTSVPASVRIYDNIPLEFSPEYIFINEVKGFDYRDNRNFSAYE